MRTIGIALLLLLLLGIVLTLNIGLFVWVTGAGLLALLPDWFWKKVGYWSKSQDWLRASVYFDGECGFCRASAQIIRAFFPREKLTLAAAQGFSEIEAEMARRNSWVVVDESRARHFAFDGVLALAQVSPFFPMDRTFLEWRLSKARG